MSLNIDVNIIHIIFVQQQQPMQVYIVISGRYR